METTVFILKIPSFATSVLQACQQWRGTSKKAGDLADSEKMENDFLLLPGDAIGLLTAMSLAAAGLPSSSLECAFEALHECLQSALSIVETKFCLTSLSDSSSTLVAEGKQCGEVGSIQTAPEERSTELVSTELVNTDVVARIEWRARRQLTIPRGLVGSLRLITDENGGARALRAVSIGTGSQHVRAQSVVLTLKGWSACVLKNSYAAKCKSRVVAMRGNSRLQTPSGVQKKESGNMEVSLDSNTDICVGNPPDSGVGTELGVGTECGVDNGCHPDYQRLISKIPEEEKVEARNMDENDEDEDEDCGSIEFEEARRLLKSLQAVLQGFSSNKTD